MNVRLLLDGEGICMWAAEPVSEGAGRRFNAEPGVDNLVRKVCLFVCCSLSISTSNQFCKEEMKQSSRSQEGVCIWAVWVVNGK